MFIVPSCSDVASTRPESLLSNASSRRSCANNPTVPRAGCFGLPTTAPPHRGKSASARLRGRWPNIVLVHTPVHASWLNQIEVYFSIVQRKLLTPNDFQNLADLRRQLMNFQKRYEQSAKPFEWTFTRRDLETLLVKLSQKPYRLAA
jgi:hypothetical protein